jgi:Bacterial type II and III secretion system protein
MARQHKVLSGGVIVLCLTLLLAPVTHSQGFRASIKKVSISGSVGLPGVTMQGLPGAPTTDDNGVYTAQVDYGWKGTVSPIKLGYTFEPKQRVYQKVTGDLTTESYSAELLTFTISGSAGMPGVKMTGLPGDPMSDQNGRYTATVEYGWSDNVTPEKIGYRFNPPSTMYDQVRKDLPNQNYKASELTFVISGSVGVDGAAMKGLPGNVVTSGGGNYRVQVPYGWEGKVTPTKEGHSFTPEYLEYPKLMSDQTNQSYTASVFTYHVSGTTNQAGVLLKGLPGDPITDTNGYYTVIVPHGWHGKVAPELAGFTFSPPNKSYPKVVSDFDSQDYNPSIIQLTISGTVGTSGVRMDGLPGNVTSDASGRYTARVEYGWTDTVTPMKEGWDFEPASQIYASVTSDRLNQVYKGQRITYTISGNVGLPGVVLEGLPGRVVSGTDGSFSADVDYNWTGKVTPKKAGFTFEPPMREYNDLLMPQFSQDFAPQIIQRMITGRIVGEEGGLADVFLFADNNGGNTTTDANGEFQLAVDHGWRGRITPTKEGIVFSPEAKPFEAVGQNISNAGFIGRVKMLKITDSIIFGDEPIQGVKITAEPGGAVAVTNAKGKYSLQVPYNWTGDLFPTKEGFDFNPPSIPYTSVTEDIDNTAPAMPAYTSPVETPSVPRTASPVDTMAPQNTATQTSTPPATAIDADRQALLDRFEVMKQEVEALTPRGAQPALPGNQTELRPDQLMTTAPQPERALQSRNTFSMNLLDVLMQISQKTGVKIGVDATVKSVPVSVDFDWTTMPVPLALQRILEPTGYTFRAVEDAYLVYHPITNTFMGDDLRQALQDIAVSAGVTIVPDPNVAGEVWAELKDVPLETALRTILAGSPFVVKVTPDYYLVADRGIEGDAFPEISETRNMRLNYISAKSAMQYLSPAFARYVKADSDPNSHVLSITAAPDMVSRIVSDLGRMDVRPRHVLLDARIVVMERTDLLDVGVEWGFPQISAGLFKADDVSGTPWGMQIGYSPDQTFTNSLLMALNLLEENGQAEIVSNPQLLAQDGKRAEMRVMKEEYYMLQPQTTNSAQFFSTTEMVSITSGTQLSITPRIGDNNDITLELAAEVSDSIPQAAETQLPVVTRRTARNIVTVQDGGTVALAGLTENRSTKRDTRVPGFSNLPLIGGLFKNKNNEGVTTEIAVFVTAHLVPETGQMPYRPAPQAMVQPNPGTRPQPQFQAPFQPQPQVAPAGNNYQDQIRQSLINQPR